MYLGQRNGVSTGIVVSICVLCMTHAALGKGAKTQDPSAKYPFPQDVFVTVSAHLVEGDLEREGSSFAKIPGVRSEFLAGSDSTFSADGRLTGLDGEVSVGKWFGVRAYEVVVGGSTASSEAAWNGSATISGGKQELVYRNFYDREEGYAGLRMTMLSGGSWASAKDAPKLQPMGFVSFGDVTVDETFSGAVGKTASNPWAYRNSVDLSHTGVGVGISASGPLTEIAQVRIGYFGALRGAAELQQATGSSQTECGSTRSRCQAVVRKELQSDQTAFFMLAEAGLSVALMTGVDIELGGRYRRMDAPQVVVGGDQDALIKFDALTEVTGFLGLKAGF
jgi:hypothetical protein